MRLEEHNRFLDRDLGDELTCIQPSGGVTLLAIHEKGIKITTSDALRMPDPN